MVLSRSDGENTDSTESHDATTILVDEQQRLLRDNNIIGKLVDVATSDGQNEAFAAKVEIRPCLMVRLTNDELGDESQVFLQQAETVRLGQGDNRFVRVTELSTNSDVAVPILLRCSSTGTHVGKSYKGKVIER